MLIYAEFESEVRLTKQSHAGDIGSLRLWYWHVLDIRTLGHCHVLTHATRYKQIRRFQI